MIKKYKKGDGFAYYFKAYHGIDPLTGKKIVTLRRGFKTEREARLAEAKCLADYEKKTFRSRNTTTTFKQVYELGKSIIEIQLKNLPMLAKLTKQIDLLSLILETSL